MRNPNPFRRGCKNYPRSRIDNCLVAVLAHPIVKSFQGIGSHALNPNPIVVALFWERFECFDSASSPAAVYVFDTLKMWLNDVWKEAEPEERGRFCNHDGSRDAPYFSSD